MHIPDNYLSPLTCSVMTAAMIPIWATAAKKVKEEMTKSKISLLGIGAAFSFIIMLFNIPLPGGTSGHAVGAVLIAILLGPWAACISISTALFIQAIMFGDGGVLAFGANCFNMAFIMPFLGYFIYKFINERVKSDKGQYIAMGIGSYIGVNMAALLAAVEFGIQPLLFKTASGVPLYSPYPLSISIPAMLLPHLLVAGFVEVAFTIGIYSFIKKVSPSMIYDAGKAKMNWVYGMIIALICLSPLGLLATGTAWGEWGTDKIKNVSVDGKVLGFVPQGMANGFNFNVAFRDYAIQGLPEPVGYVLSAAAGIAILIIVFKLIGSIFKEKASEF